MARWISLAVAAWLVFDPSQAWSRCSDVSDIVALSARQEARGRNVFVAAAVQPDRSVAGNRRAVRAGHWGADPVESCGVQHAGHAESSTVRRWISSSAQMRCRWIEWSRPAGFWPGAASICCRTSSSWWFLTIVSERCAHRAISSIQGFARLRLVIRLRCRQASTRSGTSKRRDCGRKSSRRSCR